MDELSHEQVKNLGTALHEQRVAIEQRIGPPGVAIQPADDESLDQALARRRRDQSLLQMTKAAVERIGHGEYGQCLRCGGQVSYERLHATPEATLCIDCRAEPRR